MYSNTKNLPLILFLFVFFFLLLFSMLPGNFSVFGIRIKSLDLFTDVKPDSLITSSVVFSVNPSYGAGMMLPLGLTFFSPPQKLEGNTSQMSHFLNALKDAKNKKVRVAHFGDSVIEGDLITSDLRSALQGKSGGEGIGMLSVTPDDIRFRTTVKQSFSSDWKTYSLFGEKIEGIEPGVNGTVSIPSSGSWVKIESSGIPGSFKSIKKVYLYYSHAKNSSIKYSLNNSKEMSAALQSGEGLKQLEIDAAGAKSLKITTGMNEQARFYGVSIESDKGVYVDNIPLRGNSGVSIRDIQNSMLQDFNKYLDYKLILLQFGLNMLTSGQTDYDWYEKEMVRVINNMKSIFPETSFILVGVGDKSIKRGSKIVTDPNVLKLIKAQKSIAEKTDIAFFDLYKAMGGENSMLEWANAKPPLAMKDYTHFNNEGARRIGRMLSEALLNGNVK
jgi:lysophospholipase L1-like esterase